MELTKDQLELILPVLQAQKRKAEQRETAGAFSVDEMLAKKLKGARPTPAQKYFAAIIREAAKAGNLWNTAPLLRDISEENYTKFFDCLFLICPDLRPLRSTLRTRLGATLINRRSFLLRRNTTFPFANRGPICNPDHEKQSMYVLNTYRSEASTTSGNSYEDQAGLSIEQSKSVDIEQEDLETSNNSADMKETDLSRCREVETYSSDDELVDFEIGDDVYIKNGVGTDIGRGIYLGMNTDACSEQFAKVLLKSKSDHDHELPSPVGKKTNFNELVKGNVFLWKITRLKGKKTSGYTNSIEDLSPYEMARIRRIEKNKREIEERLAAEHQFQDSVRYEEGDFVAVRCQKYREKPLIGKITQHTKTDITIDWYIGTYSGTWRPWKGREGGKTVTFTETIDRTNIIQTVTFTKTQSTTIYYHRTKSEVLIIS